MAVLTIAAKKTDHEQYKSLPYPPHPRKSKGFGGLAWPNG